jgi:Zn finger protein HypA/HybF involved in hydrogenase expression
MGDFDCRDCGQHLYQSTTRTYRSGKFMILNYEDGPGGNEGDAHECPMRSGSRFDHAKPLTPEDIPTERLCPTCGEYYPIPEICLCPNCYKKECRKCKARWVCRLEILVCPNCKSTEIEVVDTREWITQALDRMRPKQ